MKKLASLVFLLLTVVVATKVKAAEFSACYTAQCQQYFKKYKKHASNGNLDAKIVLGAMYYSGYGTIKNKRRALKEYEVAATYGSNLARYRTGVIYLDDKDSSNDKAGLFFLSKAAANNHLESVFTLAMIYLNGDFGTNDIGKADRLLTKAYQLNHPDIDLVIEQINEKPSFYLADYPKLNQALKNKPQNVTDVAQVNEFDSNHAESIEQLFDKQLLHFNDNKAAIHLMRDRYRYRALDKLDYIHHL